MSSFPAAKLRSFIASLLAGLLICSASLGYADDTEIFFGGPSIESGVRPNVLFILDNSGSMAWRTSSNSNPSGSEQSRLQILKESFATIINSAGAINAGIMVLNERSAYNNTRMVYPVSYLDDPLPGSAAQIASTPEIMLSGDDASQVDGATTAVINGPTLTMGKFQTLGNSTKSYTLTTANAFLQKDNHSCMLDPSLASPRTSGSPCLGIDQDQLGLNSNNAGTAMLFFSGLGIPAGSTVTSATLTIHPQNSNSNGFDPRVSVEQNKIAAALNDDTSIASRTFSAWRNLADTPWSSGAPVTLDITTEINGLRSVAPASDETNNLLLRVYDGHSIARTLCMRAGSNCTAAELPVLSITYTSPTPSTQTRTVALRFQNVGIPQGATIDSAHISFTPAVSNSEAVSLTIKAENAADAAVFTNTLAGAPSARAKTAATASWGPVQWTSKNPPVHVPGPDVKNLVQEVVNLGGWCGNNAMAFFVQHASGNGSLIAHSIDGASGLQPTLTVTFSGGSGGCLNPIIEANVTDPNNDAYQERDGDMELAGTTLPLDRHSFAARYTNVPLLKNASILDAKVILTPANTVAIGSAINSKVRFENASNSASFASNDRNISDRASTPDSTCTISAWSTGTPVVCSGSELRSGLQSIVDRAGWAPGNALSVISAQSADSALNVQAYESNPGQSIKLRIKVANGGLASNTYTVRQHLNALVQAMSAGNATPLVPTYYEAAQYLRGERNGYPSPITSACQPTHVVLLTDGQANGQTSASRNGITSWAGSCATPLVSTGDDPGIADTPITDLDEQCGRKLAEWLVQTDQSPLNDDSVVTTHTIGFALDALLPRTQAPTFLSDIADNGNGGAYNSNTASELTEAFSDILQSVQDVDTTFVSASAPVNSFERQNNKDELYFSLFNPQQSHRWPGNLKRYRFATIDAEGNLDPRIVDQVGRDAVDLDTGKFSSIARSYWSAETDGNDSAAGGAASRLSAPASRKLYTYNGTSPSFAAPASLTDHVLASSNGNITKTLLGDPLMSDTDRTELLDYIRGLDPQTRAERQAVGDPLHASPRLATYSCEQVNLQDSSKCDADDQTAFIGTNEGFVQAFDTASGAEEFAFMPEELLDNIAKLKENTPSSSSSLRPYGMDNPVTLWVNDANGDGKVLDNPTDTSPQTGEFVYAYATMGRGGRGLYALDVTNRASPQLLWFIKGGETAGFDKLGQTWSAPIKTRIKVASSITDVLIFAGGYHPNQDNVSELTADNYGNALYVINAKTGALIWAASSEASNAMASEGHRQLSKMLYSMPAKIRAIDLQTAPTGTLVVDPDRLADQIFVGDMGGQVWRFHINNGQSGADLITAGGTAGDGVFATVIPADYASLDLPGKRQNLRRLYNEPDVALLHKNGKMSLTINIGSGYRGHPLSIDALDRFYSLRTSNLTDPSGTEGTLSEGDLLDVTNELSPDASLQDTLDLSEGRLKGGWYISFSSNSGEKVLSRALTAGEDNALFFNTYQPAASTSSNSCEPAFGTARGYSVNLLDGTPLDPVNPDNPTASDRFDQLKVPGLPPQPELICLGDNCFVIEGPADIAAIKMPKLGKMYWIDKTDLD